MRTGLEFFPLDVHLDDKFRLIQAEYGLTGFAVIVKLLQRIYGEFGYYCLFDSNLFEKYRILTSRGIQTRYLNAVERRKKVDMDARFLLVNDESLLRNVNILNENVNILSENVNILQQSKVKESKVKESNDKAQGAIFIALPLNDGTDFNIYEGNLKELSELYPALNVSQELRNMQGWLLGNPQNRKPRAGINRFINGGTGQNFRSMKWNL